MTNKSLNKSFKTLSLSLTAFLSLAIPTFALPVYRVFRVTDTSGNPVSGATVAVGGTTLTAGTAASVSGTNLDTGAALTGQSVTYRDYADGTGEYVMSYDPATTEAHFVVVVSKSGTPLSNPTFALDFYADPSNIAAIKALTATALPNLAPGGAGGLVTGDAAGKVAVNNFPATVSLSGADETAIGALAGNFSTIAANFTGLPANIWGYGSGRTVTGGTITSIPNATVGGYATGFDPATLLLVTPANKLATNGSGQVTAASVVGSVGSVSGSVGSVTGSVGSISGITFPSNFGTFSINGSGQVTLVAGQSTIASNFVAAPTAAQVRQEIDGNSTQLQSIVSSQAAQTTAIGALPSAASLASALFGSAFITIAADHTTSGTSEVLTYKQFEALQDAFGGGDNTTVPAVIPVTAGATASVTYYLRGAAKVSGNVVAVSTVTYDASGNQVGRSVKVANPYPAIN